MQDLLKRLRQDIARQPDEADLHYALGVLLLDRMAKVVSWDSLAEAVCVLKEAVRLAPKQARHRAALAYALYWQESTLEALDVGAGARRLESDNNLFETYWLSLLADVAPELETMVHLEVAAVRQGIDLKNIRQQLAEAGLPIDSKTLLANGFLHARNGMASWLREEALRVESELNPRDGLRRRVAKERELARHQRELHRSMRADRVPVEFRHLTPWAQKLGLGDDRVRACAFAVLTPQEHAQMRSEVEPFAGAIHAWLDEHAPTEMPPEAAALMYLLLGLEE
jgi:hypothetical protein